MPAEIALLFWPLVTIALYALSRVLYRHYPSAWTSPLLVTPLALIGLAIALHAGYRDYMRGSHWLLMMLGPATVAFALPIWDQRALIRRHWAALLIGVIAGSTLAIASSWALASALHLDASLRASLVPRSVTTPFAVVVASDIGGVPELTAVFVMITGILGASLGSWLARLLPLRSSLARGALFGMGAHGAGVARAREVGEEEGSVAGLVMILAGVFNVLVAPLLAMWLR